MWSPSSHDYDFFFGSNEMINYLPHRRKKKPRGSLMWHKSNEASIKLNINSFLLSHTHWTLGENVGREAHKKWLFVMCADTKHHLSISFRMNERALIFIILSAFGNIFSSSLGDSSVNDKIGTSSSQLPPPSYCTTPPSSILNFHHRTHIAQHKRVTLLAVASFTLDSIKITTQYDLMIKL